MSDHKIDAKTEELLNTPDAKKLLQRFYELMDMNKERGVNDIRSGEMKEIEKKLAELWGINNPEALEEAMKRVFEHIDPDDMTE